MTNKNGNMKNNSLLSLKKLDKKINKKLFTDLPKVIIILVSYFFIHFLFLFPPDNNSHSIEFLLVLVCLFIVLAVSEEMNMLINILIAFLGFLILELAGFYSRNVFTIIPAIIVMASIVFALLTVFFVFIQLSQQMYFDNLKENDSNEISKIDDNKEKYSKMFTTMLILTIISFLLVLTGLNITEYTSTNIAALLEIICFIFALIMIPNSIKTESIN